MTHPVEPLGLEDVSVDLVELPPAASAPPVDAAVLALTLHPGSRRHAGEHCNRTEKERGRVSDWCDRRYHERTTCISGLNYALTRGLGHDWVALDLSRDGAAICSYSKSGRNSKKAAQKIRQVASLCCPT